MVCLFTTVDGYARIVEIKVDKMLREKRQLMNKNEFIDDLRKNLSGQIPKTEIDSNIKFYVEYISSPSEEEERRKIEEMGDPRLIAMNIVETYKISHKVSKESGRGQYEEQYEEVYGNGGDYKMNKKQSPIANIKMKVMGVASIVFVIAVVILILKVLSFTLQLVLPIIIVFFLVFLLIGIFRN